LLLSLIAIPQALAVHELAFELEGNTTVDTAGQFDWESLFDANGDEKTLPTTDFKDSGFTKDFSRGTGGAYSTVDSTTFATGSKDILSISPGWQCNHDNNVNDKIDITNAYAAEYIDPGSGDRIMYFALERFSNDGDANVGFWFLQGDVSCDSPGGSEAFVGNHQDGDILVVSSFTKGGVVSTINAYEWVGDDNTGHVNPTPVATGGDCKALNIPADHTTCATVNTATITPPWDNENKRGGGNVRRAEFFEGGLNLTRSDITAVCFNTFLADTRSSQSLTATLFDFARGTLGECGLGMTTVPTGDRLITDTTAVTDTATVTGTSSGGTPPTPTGSEEFRLGGPPELTPADDTGICDTGDGTLVSTNSVSGSGGVATATSDDAQSLITGLGKYCFTAFFTAAANDPNYAGKTAETSNPTQECFHVTGTAALSTAQDWVPNDSATITGPGPISGTATFTLFDDATCNTMGTGSNTAVYGPVEVAVSGTDSVTVSTSNSTTVVAATEGDYSWLVSYDDDVLGDPSDTCEKSNIQITD
jgi:hypothetical protein